MTGGKRLISALANTGCLCVICVLGELSLFAGGVSYDNNNNSTNNHRHVISIAWHCVQLWVDPSKWEAFPSCSFSPAVGITRPHDISFCKEQS